MKNIDVTIIRPGGNDTALIKGIVSKDKRKKINNAVMKQFPNVEQVGFYDYDKNKNLATLEMAGGEFCGNALRALAFLLIKSRSGKITVRASGTKQLLNAGIKNGYSYAQIPIKQQGENVTNISKNVWQVELDGITHIIIYIKSPKINREYFISYGKELLRKTTLDTTRKAAGVIFVTEDAKIFPLVWVRDVQTLFLETACGSGTSAVALQSLVAEKRSQTVVTLIQPSNIPITATIKTMQNELYEEIYGLTEMVTQTNIQITD